MKEQYYIDWINSLDIKDSIFINTIEELYQNDNNILLNIISIILNKKIDEFVKEEEYKNLNYITKISMIMKNNFDYIYEINDELNLKNNTLLLIKFLKSKYPNNIRRNDNKIFSIINNINITYSTQIKERPKSSKVIHNLSVNKETEEKNQIGKIMLKNTEKKMEEFIMNYLLKLGIITEEQKNREYFWKKLIPDLKGGYIIGKLINLLDNKSKLYLKGISNETFYKVNIYLNWKKIKDFLLTKESFNTTVLFQKNFFEKDINIFYLLYGICHYYYLKKEIKSKITICKRSKSSKQIDNKKNKDIKFIKKEIKINGISSKEEIMKIRQKINNNHTEKNNKANNDINNKDINNKMNLTEIKSINNIIINDRLNKKIKIILSFLSTIGIDTSEINFNSKEMKIFKDGILLYKIISQLEQNKNLLPKIDLNPKQVPSAINNHRLIINFLLTYKKNFPVKFTGKERELYKAKTEFILNFLLVIKNVYKNELYFFEKIYGKNNSIIIYPKNIDKSERLSIPLDNKLRNKFIIHDFKKIWA